MALVSLVTGAARGIGRAIALRLADDGFNVAINDISINESELLSLKSEIESKGRKCCVAIADISIEAEVISMIEETVSTLGKLNVMIANAGVILVKPLLEITPDEWDKVQAVNVRGVFLCYKHAAKQLIKQGHGGKILGACSISGYRPSPSAPAYSVSKWAIRGLTQAAALDLAAHNITVNSYCPGMVRTDMWETIDSTLAERHGVEKGTIFKQAQKERIALGRPQSPEDIAGLVSYLASKDSDQMTGQSIIMDGGVVFS